MEPTYRHGQFGTFSLVLSPIMVIGAGLVWILERDLPGAIALLVADFLVVTILCRMTVEISRGYLIWSLGVGLLRKRVPVSEILTAETVRNPWYYGWGIHRMPRGWVYNVSGFGAVEIAMKSGRRFRLGTDEPDELARAVLKARSPAADSPRGNR